MSETADMPRVNLTVEEAAGFLRRSRDTIERRIKRGELLCHRVGDSDPIIGMEHLVKHLVPDGSPEEAREAVRKDLRTYVEMLATNRDVLKRLESLERAMGNIEHPTSNTEHRMAEETHREAA